MSAVRSCKIWSHRFVLFFTQKTPAIRASGPSYRKWWIFYVSVAFGVGNTPLRFSPKIVLPLTLVCKRRALCSEFITKQLSKSTTKDKTSLRIKISHDLYCVVSRSHALTRIKLSTPELRIPVCLLSKKIRAYYFSVTVSNYLFLVLRRVTRRSHLPVSCATTVSPPGRRI
jgi:hypothetical protein